MAVTGPTKVATWWGRGEHKELTVPPSFLLGWLPDAIFLDSHLGGWERTSFQDGSYKGQGGMESCLVWGASSLFEVI